ncbi:outer membrane beta-barrel family protein [Maribacter sp.]|uniref:outer membrane beta-barrel family protein n=1 Tax=Maribacter sp. TaxID=1897614 RepID=UPI0025BFE266|nr:outer membrane beta-barrel family protein [Maribacter sp.]
MKKTILLLFVTITFYTNAQRPGASKVKRNLIKLTGLVLDKDNNLPLEYATIILQNVNNPKKVTGGITNEQGKFSVQVPSGKYTIKIEYLSYKTITLEDQLLRISKDIGTIKLLPDLEQLDGVEVIGERTTVELRLDKKVYNVGSDLTVKGGSVTDVLDNVPSVTVDEEGAISLRGNESVRILINGKPSALSGLSTEALQQLPADAIEKVEVITNPSARYDAEGTAGILNIILKQSKTTGLNGSFTAYTGYPKKNGLSLNLNLRKENFNIFTNASYYYKDSPGNALFQQENFTDLGATNSYQDEYRKYQRQQDGFNTNIGFEFFIDSTSSITNSLVYKKSDGKNFVDINFFNFDANKNPTIQRNRYTNETENDEDVQYSLNYQKKFNNKGHELTFDYQYSSGNEIENSIINETILNDNSALDTEQTINDETQKNQLIQIDYVLPFGKNSNSQLELGYRGIFNKFNTDFNFGILDETRFINDTDYSNELNYKEYLNAAYMQLGTKFNKFNILSGIRMESSDIGIELVNTNEITNKNYVDWFPSLFLGYGFSEKEQLTLSYSRRLRRPRSWFINPFPSRSSNTNLFQGNPDLDPTYTNAFDFGYLKRWDKISFTTSAYYNRSTGVFAFITQERGDFVEIQNPDDVANPILVPVQVRTPINLATDTRYGMELTTTYNPLRGWRINWNVNLFKQIGEGNYSYINFQNQTITQNFDSNNLAWFTRLSAKIPLPFKIDLQTNVFYRGPKSNTQTDYKGVLSTSLGLSKDVIKDKASLSLNVSDLFNSRKRISESKTTNIFTYSEFQRRERQITLSFSYRFNPQNLKQKERRERNNDDSFDIEG